MTLEMQFECLLVSDDPAVLSAIDPILHSFSIATNLCSRSRRTGNWLKRSSADLVVVDLDAVGATELWCQLQQFQGRQRPIVMGVSPTDRVLPDVHLVLRKPVTHDAGVSSLKAAYSKMLQEFRKHSRFAVMESARATSDSNTTLSVVVTNIGAGGVGITTNEPIEAGNVLSFRVKLPELEVEVFIRARVLWAKPGGVAGCEFLELMPHDAQLLHAWLESRYRIKKPVKAREQTHDLLEQL